MAEEFQLTGHVSYSVEKKYKWLTEPGTCKTCKAMHGKLYEENKVPKRPHPNCKCHVVEVSVIDSEISKMHDYKEEFAILKKEASKLSGDLNLAKNNLSREVPIPNDKTIKNEKKQLTEEIDYLKNRIDTLTNELNSHSVINYIGYIKQKSREIESIRLQISVLKKKIDDLRVKNSQSILDEIIEQNKNWGNDAAALWKIASSKFKDGMDYVEKNGYVVNKVSDLKNEQLEKIVREKLASQKLKTESRGIVLNESSTLAKSLADSSILHDYIKNNVVELALKDRLSDNVKRSLSFNVKDLSFNNYLALHNVDIRDIHLDKNNMVHITFVDTIDYNFGESFLSIPREIQEHGLLENYYVIIKVTVPFKRWVKYLE